MNPTRFLLLVAITALLGSCTKDYPAPENTSLLPVPSIEFFYPEGSEIGSSTERPAFFDPLSTSQPCKSNTSSILVPRIIVGNRIEVIYANIKEFSSNIDPKGIRWVVNDETLVQIATTLKLPYIHGKYKIKAIVTLKDDTERLFEFTLDVSHDMPLDKEGYIDYNQPDPCVTGTTVGPSCLPLIGRAVVIVVVDPIL